MVAVAAARPQPLPPNLPSHRDPYYAGQWQKPKSPRYVETISPGTGEPLGKVIDGSAADAEAAIAAPEPPFASGGTCRRSNGQRCCARSPTCCARTAMSLR